MSTWALLRRTVHLVILCVVVLLVVGPAVSAAPTGSHVATPAPGNNLTTPRLTTRPPPNHPAKPMDRLSTVEQADRAPTGPVLHDTHTVTSTQDSGPGSLRQAIADASGGDTIDFALDYPATITLASGELVITKSLTILGPGAENLAIRGNSTGRIFVVSGASTVVALVGLAVTGGRTSGAGGGIYNEGTLMVTHATFSSNSARIGGGIANNGTLTVTNATFFGNAASSYSGSAGGGIYNGGTLTVANATFASNGASGYYGATGGGICNEGIMTVTNATFSGNDATYGGGIANGGTLYLRSTIIANSTEGGDCYNSGTIGQNIANLITDGSCSPLYSGDPNLGPLGGYGGDTWTHALISPSLAIDHGNPGTCPATDQRGYPRVGVCDIGAFEGPFICEPTVTVTSDTDCGNGATLRNAIAWICPGGTIDFALPYPATIILTGVQLDIPKSLTIVGPGAENLTVSANLASRVFAISGASTTVALSGLAVTDGWTFQRDGGGIANSSATLTVSETTFSCNQAHYYGSGGGIANSSGGTLTVVNTTFFSNTADYWGGSIYNDGTLTVTNATFANNTTRERGGGIYNDGTVTVTNAIFSDNAASSTGGGIGNGGKLIVGYTAFSSNTADCGGGIANEGTLTVTNATVSGNTARERGGGIYNDGTLVVTNATFSDNEADWGGDGKGGGIDNGGTLTVTNAIFSGNHSGYGGGISNSGTLTVINATFSGNGVLGSGWGGGIYNAHYGTLTNATFSGNTASYWGGGIYNDSYGRLTVNNATFSGNGASSAGGIGKGGGTLAVTNATFSGNTADYWGGGILNWAGTLTVTNATFSGNTATYGGGIWNWHGTLNLRSTIIANSTAGGDCGNEGTIGQNVANLIEDGSCSPLYSGDPNLGPLGDYGGDTWTHALLYPSEAIDHGDPATCPVTDQRGFPRYGPCDIGAFEFAPCTPVTSASFSWLPLTPTAGQAVTFTGTVTTGDEPITYTWKLDVGSWPRGQVVTHTYDLPGTYAVVMTATNCATATATAVHTLTVDCEGVSILSVTPAVCGCSVTFCPALSGTPPFAYLWDFGPFGTSTATNPQVVFGTSGTYSGTLSVWNCGNMEPAIRSFTVEVDCSRECSRHSLPIVFRYGP